MVRSGTLGMAACGVLHVHLTAHLACAPTWSAAAVAATATGPPQVDSCCRYCQFCCGGSAATTSFTAAIASSAAAAQAVAGHAPG